LLLVDSTLALGIATVITGAAVAIYASRREAGRFQFSVAAICSWILLWVTIYHVFFDLVTIMGFLTLTLALQVFLIAMVFYGAIWGFKQLISSTD
jgi:CDP-diglyceride synthetase